jgi:hypothetical protein
MIRTWIAYLGSTQTNDDIKCATTSVVTSPVTNHVRKEINSQYDDSMTHCPVKIANRRNLDLDIPEEAICVPQSPGNDNVHDVINLVKLQEDRHSPDDSLCLRNLISTVYSEANNDCKLSSSKEQLSDVHLWTKSHEMDIRRNGKSNIIPHTTNITNDAQEICRSVSRKPLDKMSFVMYI